eukprot:CAMPEP_0185791252 /NCGR_PEP_ID=MMETSP1174-20130828/158270_1 /TAXON_ID=35687 /ORGANISM="Dictyocha speculum, Strain CCMP1381" /LENGTH=616 /DNA_ID=CAMNT_0028486177 /DNA_START=8 /DNA_END=1859 /DNA_ORIENTATION=+
MKKTNDVAASEEISQRIDQLKTRLHRRLMKIARWSDTPLPERMRADEAMQEKKQKAVERVLAHGQSIKASSVRQGARPKATERCAGKTRTGTSKYLGVYADKSGKWTAQISHGGKQHYLGRYATEEDAATAYRLATDAVTTTGKVTLPSGRVIDLFREEPKKNELEAMREMGHQTSDGPGQHFMTSQQANNQPGAASMNPLDKADNPSYSSLIYKDQSGLSLQQLQQLSQGAYRLQQSIPPSLPPPPPPQTDEHVMHGEVRSSQNASAASLPYSSHTVPSHTSAPGNSMHYSMPTSSHHIQHMQHTQHGAAPYLHPQHSQHGHPQHSQQSHSQLPQQGHPQHPQHSHQSQKGHPQHPQHSHQSHSQHSQQGHPQLSQLGHPQLSQQSHLQHSQQVHPQHSQQGHPQHSQQGHPQLSQQGHPQHSQQGLSQPSQQGHPQLTHQGHSQLSQQSHLQLSQQGHSQHSQQGHTQHSQQGHSQPSQQGHSQHSQQGHPQHSQQGHSQPSQQGHPQLTQQGHSQHSQQGHSQLSQQGLSQHSQQGHSQLSQQGHSQLAQQGHSQQSQQGHLQHSQQGHPQPPHASIINQAFQTCDPSTNNWRQQWLLRGGVEKEDWNIHPNG